MMIVGIVAMFKTIYRCRNDIIFQRKLISDPTTMVKLMCNEIVDWSILQIRCKTEGC